LNLPSDADVGASVENAEKALAASQLQVFIMSPRIYVCEARVFRNTRGKEVLCRLKYEVTPFNDGLFRWFLIDIQELE